MDGAVAVGRHEPAPVTGLTYTATVDPTGGGADTFSFAIVHVETEGEDRAVVQDVMRGWGRVGGQAPDLVGVVREIAATCRAYGLTEVTGDRYAAGWVRQAFQEAGLMYRESAVDKSRAYLEAEPLFARGAVVLLDHPALLRELKTLERRPRAGGKDVVDHRGAATMTTPTRCA